ncbi:ATPase, partial [bacterium]|nr:ATPase [candidate division CSSED10-310 bacterium]
GNRDVKVDAKTLTTILFGRTPIDLSAVEQLVDVSQTRAVAQAIIRYMTGYAEQHATLREGLEAMDGAIDAQGLDALTAYSTGNLARPRVFEIAAAINRLRGFRTLQ